MAKKKDSDKNYLKIGDYVTLKSVIYDGFMSAEGILSEDIVVTSDLERFDDALFQIHFQRQYSASRELDDFLRNYEINTNEALDESTTKYLTALRRGRNNENNLNDVYMKSNMGKIVCYGDVIQLFHVKSKKYLMILPKDLAVCERENITVRLNDSGNFMSWLSFMPRFKIDREGDKIRTQSEIFVRMDQQNGDYIHCADKKFNYTSDREVNCSLESCSWKLNIYQSSSDAVDESWLLSNEIVYITDPETRTGLTIPKISLGDNLDDINVSAMSPDYAPEIVLSAMQDGYINSNFLWCIESLSRVVGGPFNWKNEVIKLKHLNTGLYLKATVSEDDSFILETTRDQSDPTTSLSANLVAVSSSKLMQNKPVQLGFKGLFFERGEVNEELNTMLQGTRDKTLATNLLINKYVIANADEADTIKGKRPQPLDVFSGMSIRRYLRKYFEMSVVPKDDLMPTVWPGAQRHDMPFFQQFMDRAVYFSQGFDIKETNIQLGVDKADAKVKNERQNLIRELGILEILLRIINKLTDVTKRSSIVATLRGKQLAQISDDVHAMLNMGHEILRRCFNLLYYSILDHPENQMFVADFMPILLAHLGTHQPLAGKCVTEMLSKNMELQETKIGSREIAIFVDKLRTSKMGSMYLNLLQSCCSCMGDGVDNNQCKVAQMLFEDTNDIIIQCHANYATTAKVDWQQANSLYIPPAPQLGAPIMGSQLLTRGLPNLSLSWTTKSIDFSPLGLFGKLSVNIEELYDAAMLKAARKAAAKGAKTATSDQKNAVSNYFVNELYLSAEMCLNRNYIAMHLLDPLFPYDVLVTMMKMDIDSALKAAVVRLIMCLHVDRDPQAVSRIPCLTRTWSEVQKNPTPRLPYVELSRRNTFALIQQLISEHVQGMAGKRWEELSHHMLKLLSIMVNFNFYGTSEKINDVIGPLISVLDRRSVDFDEKTKTKKSDKAGDPSSAGDEEGVVEEVVEEPAVPWQRPVLDFLESIPVLLAVLGLVVVAVSLLGYQMATDTPDTPGTWLFAVGIVIMCIFIVETGSRAYCYAYLNGEIMGWLKNHFNQIDVTVISLDIIFLCLPTGGGSSSTKFAKTLRLVRLLRLMRILRAARVVNSLTNRDKEVMVVWKPPSRFTKAPIHELETMVESLNILAYCQQVIEDRNISIFLRHFLNFENKDDRREIKEIFESIVTDSQELSLNICDFDLVMIDLIMFVHTPLVQSCLEIVMAHHSMRRTLLTNVKDLQLLVSLKRERQFKIVEQMLQQLERNAEAHELWGELKTESDLAVNKQTKDIMTELTEILKIKRQTLEFDENYMSDVEMQNLFRNLGCFEISMKVIGLIDSVDADEDGHLGEIAINTRDLCFLISELLFWFFIGNAKNQELGYEELPFFLENLDSEIKTDRIVKSIFSNNEQLMKMVPYAHLAELVDTICQSGQRPQYLTLFTAITFVGEKNIPKNQFEVMKSLTSPGIIGKTLCFFCSVEDEEYKEKQALMKPFLKYHHDLTMDKVDIKLAYHLNLLEVLSGCTVGRVNVTTVEAKLQTLFNVLDVINAILDKQCILYCKLLLARFLFNAYVEVEMSVPGLDKSNCIWQLMYTFPKAIDLAMKHIELVEKHGWGHELVYRQAIEYGLVCINIVGVFFTRYFDASTFKLDEGSAVIGEKVKLSIDEVNELIKVLFEKARPIHEFNSTKLSYLQKNMVFETLEALNRSCIKSLTTGLERPAETVEEDKNAALVEEDNNIDVKVLSKWSEFIAALDNDPEIQAAADNENMDFIRVMESLPYIRDPTPGDVRYETLIKKLVVHVRENISIVNNEKRLNSRCTKTTSWIIKAFRTMIENRMGMTIYERDEDGGEEQDIAAAPVVNALNSCGATTLCLDLIAIGIDENLQTEAMKLCVALLFKEGGALEVQDIMNKYLTENQTELFFKQCRITIQKIIAVHKWNQVIELKDGEEPSLCDDIIILRFLQLMCEGHYKPNQDILRDQPWNTQSVNLLDDFVLYLNALTRIPCRTSTAAAISVAAVILEVIQGPCEGNQVHFTMNTELIETLNRMLRAKVVRDQVREEEAEVKITALAIFRGLLESQGKDSVVYDRVLSVIHLDVIQVMAKPRDVAEDKGGDEGDIEVEEVSDEDIVLQTGALVLLQMFCDFKASLYEELGISRSSEDMAKSGTGCIEVLWNGVLNRRFFYIPSLCYDLAKSTKDIFVEECNRSNQENKLIDFMSQSRNMYREVKHQQVLKEMGLSDFFSPKIQDQVTWVMFIISCAINLILLASYKLDANGEPSLPTSLSHTILGLNICLVLSAFGALIQYSVVKSPVIYQTCIQNEESVFSAILTTATDTMTLYYVFYVIINFLGIFLNYYYLSILLLDIIIKNSTTRDVLKAVVSPRKQIAMALVLTCFVIYIYAFFIFLYFRDQFINPTDGTSTCGVDSNGNLVSCCDTLYNCLKMTFGYGLRSGGGIADTFAQPTDSYRLILDLSYYCFVIVVLLNVIFGIIIDTFSSLRSEKVEKLLDTTEKCFICGIDKQVFDRNFDGAEGFQHHIKTEHNMWNYLYFIFYLWEQDKDDDDGLEQFVRRMVEDDKISFFPINKAMSLQQGASIAEQMRIDMTTSVAHNSQLLTSKVDALDFDLKSTMNTVFEVLCAATDGRPIDLGEVDVAIASSSFAGGSSSSKKSNKSTHDISHDAGLDDEPLTDDEGDE